MKKRVVVCAGTFDFLHQGHLHFLRSAKALGDHLIVIVARDETVKRIKGFSPSHTEGKRKKSVEETGVADQVVLGHLNSDIFQILEELKPDIVALGYDQRVSEKEILAHFPNCTVVRISSFMPETYKSSLFRGKA